jgi:hypothetical protein
MKLKLLLLMAAIMPLITNAQDANSRSLYYAGFNPIAPFAGIRPGFASGTLPAAANLESGVSLFIGKIWNAHYNVETRFSYGAPNRSARQFVVQSGMNYCFNNKYRHQSLMKGTYAGLFIKLQALRNAENGPEKSAMILYWSIGRRFVHKRYFADVRISQHILGVKWSDEKNSKAYMGFHPSIYDWKTPYMPFVGVGIGYILSR